MDVKRRSAVDRLGRMTCVVQATNTLLVQVAAFMRQVVTLAGWLVLLVSTLSLLGDPHVSTVHLITPGAAAMAVLQSFIKTRSNPLLDAPAKDSVEEDQKPRLPP